MIPNISIAFVNRNPKASKTAHFKPLPQNLKKSRPGTSDFYILGIGVGRRENRVDSPK